MKLLLLSLSLLTAAFGQNQYGVNKATTLSAAAEVITIQGNASTGTRLYRDINLVGFDVYCSVACDVTLERDGTAATTTTLTPTAVNKELPAATAVAFASSNVGVGTVIGRYTVAAGGTTAVSLKGKSINRGGGNITIRTSSITGDVKINAQWNEN